MGSSGISLATRGSAADANILPFVEVAEQGLMQPQATTWNRSHFVRITLLGEGFGAALSSTFNRLLIVSLGHRSALESECRQIAGKAESEQ